RAADIQERIQELQQELTQLLGASLPEHPVATKSGNKRKSAAWRKALSQAMKARWAARKSGNVQTLSVKRKTKKPASEARLKALPKARAARWAKYRAARK